jgi:hypothetical protein
MYLEYFKLKMSTRQSTPVDLLWSKVASCTHIMNSFFKYIYIFDEVGILSSERTINILVLFDKPRQYTGKIIVRQTNIICCFQYIAIAKHLYECNLVLPSGLVVLQILVFQHVIGIIFLP